MSDWTRVTMKVDSVYRMFRRACRHRGVSAETSNNYFFHELRYRTDGVATLAVVGLSDAGLFDVGLGGSAVYGYGMAVRAVGDEHNEHLGASVALRRAMDCAASAIAHREVERAAALAKRINDEAVRTTLENHLLTTALAGDVAKSMLELLAESDRERARR